MSETGPGEAIPFWHEGHEAGGEKRAAKKPMSAIQPITMPKWGLAMEEGMLAKWSVEEGAAISSGQEILDIETTKIANVFESPVAGVLRRKVVGEGDTVPVGALLGVVADAETAEGEIEAYVADFLAGFKPAEKGESGAPAPEIVDVGGQKIRHLRAGPETGTPILLIHGFGGDLLGWMFNQGALAENAPVYAIDLPGHGGSTKTVSDGSVASLAATIVKYMDAVGISKAHLVGHSLGGAVALEIALTAPDRVTALTLIAPAGLGTEISGAYIKGFITESRARKLRPVLEMLVSDPDMVTADMVEEVLKFKRLDGALAALQLIADASFSGDTQRVSLRERLGEVKAPVRIIWGEADRVVPAHHADDLPPSVQVTRIPGAGHLPQMEKAAEVNAAIRGR